MEISEIILEGFFENFFLILELFYSFFNQSTSYLVPLSVEFLFKKLFWIYKETHYFIDANS
jgi:hypothetical protein